MRRHASRVGLLLTFLLCVGSVNSAGRWPAAMQPTPIKVFNLTVSLEWEPGAKDSLPADLALAGCSPAAVGWRGQPLRRLVAAGGLADCRPRMGPLRALSL